MTKRPLRVEWPTLGLIIATYASWIGAGFFYAKAPLLALIAMAILNALHSSLVHEVIHGHPTRNAKFNSALVFVNPGLIWPFHRYRKMHLNHHADERLTDPFDDPESYYRALYLYDALPNVIKTLLGLSNTLIGRLILGPPMSTLALILGDGRSILNGDRVIMRAWGLHALGLLPVVYCLIFWFQIPLWLYLVTACYGGAAIISLRTFAEHRWHETPEGRTIIVERSPLSFLFLNNNLHLVHHQQPSAPWYELPKLYSDNRDHWAALNHGYVYSNYWKLFQSYALIAKEPVVHPVWHRNKDTE